MMRLLHCGDCSCWSNDHNEWCSKYDIYTLGAGMVCSPNNIKRCRDVVEIDTEELIVALRLMGLVI